MGTIKDIYDVLKDMLKNLKDFAKNSRNQDMLELAMEIQDKIFEIKDEMQNQKDANLQLQKKLDKAEKEILKLNSDLKEFENIKLKLSQYENIDNDLAFYGEPITLHFNEIHYVYTSYTTTDKKTLRTTLDEIFKNISLKMMSPISQNKFIDIFTTLCEGYYVDEKDALKVKAQFLALDLIELTTDKNGNEVIRLTSKGTNEMKKLNTLKQGDKNAK